jgi:pimeloyl-ACP methyl ester carboxylesterase
MTPEGAAVYFDFATADSDLAGQGRPLRFHHMRWEPGRPLEFTHALQFAEMDPAGMAHLARTLNGIRSMSVGGWFYCRRAGEQVFFSRGLPETAPGGERMFRPGDRHVNFCLGTDQHGFFMGTVNGNGRMPFPYVTLNEARIGTWNQLVVVKDSRGYQKYYQNGALVHTDREAVAAGKVWPFREAEGPAEEAPRPVRLAMPMGGLIGEAWVYPRELSPEEIQKDWLDRKARYSPAPPGEAVSLREMNAHPAAYLWKEAPTAENWAGRRRRILAGAMEVLGPFPEEKVALAPRVLSEEDCGAYLRRKVSLAVQPRDRMPAYLLIPKSRKGRVPAIVCFYGTTSGAGKETTVGLVGSAPGTPPEKNRAFAVDMVEAGFVAFAGDYLRDGERVEPGMRPYDTTRFYERFPDWSVHGKDVWDTMRAIDYLQTLDFVDPDRIGMVGHSYGGHSTVFTAALEPRIRAAVSNGPVSAFREHGMHWAVPKGASSSQSLPRMRPYILDPTLPLPVTFYEFTALIAPRPLLVGQAVGERRPAEEENHAAVSQVYRALGHADRVRYHWYAGDHDFPPVARAAAVDWFRRWLRHGRT